MSKEDPLFPAADYGMELCLLILCVTFLLTVAISMDYGTRREAIKAGYSEIGMTIRK
jgi:hypothetical protein